MQKESISEEEEMSTHDCSGGLMSPLSLLAGWQSQATRGGERVRQESRRGRRVKDDKDKESHKDQPRIRKDKHWQRLHITPLH